MGAESQRSKYAIVMNVMEVISENLSYESIISNSLHLVNVKVTRGFSWGWGGGGLGPIPLQINGLANVLTVCMF